MRKVTMTKRFYIGSQDMAESYHKNGEPSGNMGLLAEKIEEAKKVLEAHPARNCVFIVEVIKVVRNQPRPVIIESTR